MSEIFISHSSRDNDVAIAIRDWLIENNWNSYFLDFDGERGIVAGDRWQSSLRLATGNCRVIILILSKSWVNSDWSKAEFIAAKSLGKPILAIKVDDIDVASLPSELTAEYQLADLTAIGEKRKFEITTLEGEARTLEFAQSGLKDLFSGLQRTDANPNFFAWPPENDANPVPFRGLEPYREEDAGIYFGRTMEISNALANIRRIADNDVASHFAILGASGSGKSSFAAAGLLPRLKRERDQFIVLKPIRPDQEKSGVGATLADALALAFTENGAAVARGELSQVLNNGNIEMLVEYLKQLFNLCGHHENSDLRLVITIDQAETLYQDSVVSEYLNLSSVLREIRKSFKERVLIVFTIRSSDYELLQNDESFKDRAIETFSLASIPQGAYKELIEGPIKRYSAKVSIVEFTPDLVDYILRKIDEDRSKDILPLLAFTLRKLFDDFSVSGKITRNNLISFGGLEGSINSAIMRVLKLAENDPNLPSGEAEKLAILKHGLIPWTAGIDFKTGKPVRNVAYFDLIPDEAKSIIQLLVQERLLTLDRDADTNQVTVEPAHEAFIRCWADLNGWLQEDRPLLAILDLVKTQTLLWETNEKSPDRLSLNEDSLHDAKRLLENRRFKEQLSPSTIDYIQACQDKENTDIRRLRFAKIAVAGCVFAILVSVGLFFVITQKEKSLRHARTFEAARIAFAAQDYTKVRQLAEPLLNTSKMTEARQLIVSAAVRRDSEENLIHTLSKASRSNIVVSGDRAFVGLDDSKLLAIDINTGGVTEHDMEEPNAPNDLTTNRIIKLKPLAGGGVAVLHLNGRLLFLNNELTVFHTETIDLASARISDIRVSPNGLVWGVLAEHMNITRCDARNNLMDCNSRSFVTPASWTGGHWLLSDKEKVTYALLDDQKLSYEQVDFFADTKPSIVHVNIPKIRNCSNGKFKLRVRDDVLFATSNDCSASMYWDHEALELVPLNFGQVDKFNNITIDNSAYFGRCNLDAICKYNLVANETEPAGSLKTFQLPNGFQRIDIASVSAKTFLAIGTWENTTNIFKFSDATIIKPIIPYRLGTEDITQLNAMEEGTWAISNQKLVKWKLFGATSFTQLTIPSQMHPDLWRIRQSINLPNDKVALLIEYDKRRYPPRLVVLQDDKIAGFVELESNARSIAVANGDVVVFGDSINWMTKFKISSDGRNITAGKFEKLTAELIGDYLERYERPWSGLYKKDTDQYVLSMGNGKVVLLDNEGLNAEELSSIYSKYSGRTEGANSLSISTDGNWLVTSAHIGTILPIYSLDANNDENAIIINLDSFRLSDQIEHVSFSPDGKHLLVMSSSGTIILFTWKSDGRYEKLYEMDFAEDGKKFFDAEWISNGSFVISASGGEVRFLSVDIQIYIDHLE